MFAIVCLFVAEVLFCQSVNLCQSLLSSLKQCHVVLETTPLVRLGWTLHVTKYDEGWGSMRTSERKWMEVTRDWGTKRNEMEWNGIKWNGMEWNEIEDGNGETGWAEFHLLQSERITLCILTFNAIIHIPHSRLQEFEYSVVHGFKSPCMIPLQSKLLWRSRQPFASQ